MPNKLSAMPVTLAFIFVWIIIWGLTAVNANIASALCGNGIAKIGNEYYRFMTAFFTHTDLIHLLVNISAMFWIGFLYEQKIGSVRFLSVGIVCALLAQFIFLCIYKNAEGSMGGSVLNFALCGFGLTLQMLLPDFPKMRFGTWSGSWLFIYLIAANIPFLPFMNITAVVIHAIAFGLGIAAALVCYLFGMR